MAQNDRKSKAQLAAMYSSAEWRGAFLRILNLASLLRNSIISMDYRIPDELNNSIHLTPEGAEVAKQLTTKNDVPYKEAKLMCLLVTAYRDLLVDVERTNYLVAVDEISKQIKAGDIKHPFIFGRLLYDKAADLFPDERKYLSVSDTSRLLEGTPAGVWQVGELVTGPYGILRSSVDRTLVPHTDVPLQHCSDLACNSIHYVELTTDYEAPINTHRPKLSRLLEAGGREPSDWNGFIDDILTADKQEDSKYDDLHPASLTYLLGDALAESELRGLLARLLDSTGPELRSVAATVELKGPSEAMVASLERAQLLQLILCSSDDEIVKNLDASVREAQIEIPVGEVRRARVNHKERHGRWRLTAELGSKGVRFRASTWNLPILRLRRLIRSLYDIDNIEDMQNLDWQLRDIDALTPAAKLAEYSRIEAPSQVIRNLVLARREYAEKACEFLGLPPAGELSDDDIVASLLWKLGFRQRDMSAPHTRFFARQETMIKLATAAQLSSAVDEEPIRSAAVLYFQDLEALLNDSLAYSTWAFTNDHYASERPYVYRSTIDSSSAFQQLSRASAAHGSSGSSVTFGDVNTMYPLSRGFDVLANHLESIRVSSEDMLRAPDAYPKYPGRTSLQHFPFRHTCPFLDVQANAQIFIIAELRSVSRLLLSHDVPEIRNSLVHFRRTVVDVSKVIAGLEAVNQAVRQLNSLGFVRVPYLHSSTTVDEWGRQTITLANRDGQKVSFTRPSAYDWLPLPSLSEGQYLMHSALFAEPNEVLRFTPGYDSLYQDLWTNYPRRRATKDNSVAKQSEAGSGSGGVDATGRSSARTG